MLSPEVVSILACPRSRQAMIHFSGEAFFLCPTCRLRFDVRDGVPDFVDATAVPAAEVERLVARSVTSTRA